MAVFEALLADPGELISTERILAAAWPDRVVTRDSVSTAIYQLRKLLGDETAAPNYIRTEPRRGYRLIAPVVPTREQIRAWPFVATIGSICVLGILGFVMQFNPHASAVNESPQLYVVPLENETGDATLKPLSVAMDATLFSALVRMNPSNVAARLENDESPLRLESQVVACDLGPALVVRLLDVHKRQYLWSRTYALDDNDLEPTVVEYVAREVTDALTRT